MVRTPIYDYWYGEACKSFMQSLVGLSATRAKPYHRVDCLTGHRRVAKPSRRLSLQAKRISAARVSGIHNPIRLIFLFVAGGKRRDSCVRQQIVDWMPMSRDRWIDWMTDCLWRSRLKPAISPLIITPITIIIIDIIINTLPPQLSVYICHYCTVILYAMRCESVADNIYSNTRQS